MSQPAHVRIVLLTGLGDVIHGLPIACAIRRAWTGAHITWVTEPMPAAVLAPHPAIDRVVVYEKKRGAAGIAKLRSELAKIPRPDITINFNIYFKSIWPTFIEPARERWSFGRDRARDGVWLAANHQLPPRPRRHTQDMFLEFADALGVDASPLEWRLQITDEERETQRRFVEELGGRRMVAIVPASANRSKDWNAAGYARTVDAIESDFGMRAVLIGGPGQRENDVALDIIHRAHHKPINALGDDVRRLLWLIDAASLVIAPDTGPVHIARALQTPVIGLYGHTNPWRVGPYRWCEDLWIDRYNDDPSVADASLAEPKSGRMERITANDVIERIDRWRSS